VREDRIETRAWIASVRVIGPLRADHPARLEASVELRDGYHLNAARPILLLPSIDPALRFEKIRVGRDDGIELFACPEDAAQACRAVLSVRFTAVEGHPAPSRAGGTLVFSACDGRRCFSERVALSARLAEP